MEQISVEARPRDDRGKNAARRLRRQGQVPGAPDGGEGIPADIPGEIRVDISELMIGKQLRVGDLPIDAAKIKLVSDPQRVVAHVVALRAEEEKPAEAVAAEAAAPAEPEVIKKGKKEAEEGEEAAAAPAAEEKEKERPKK